MNCRILMGRGNGAAAQGWRAPTTPCQVFIGLRQSIEARRAAPNVPASEEDGPGAVVIRRIKRHLNFLAGLLPGAIAVGIAYRYLFDPLEEQTLPFYIRSCFHAIGLTWSGWAVHLAFASVRRSRLGGALRRLPLAAEFAIKALVMTTVLTFVAVGLQFVLYPFPLSKRWVADELPGILVIAFTASLLVGAIFEFRRLVGGRVLGSFLLGTYHRPKREQRIVMFLDMQGSTALAERMGELRVHDLITQFFFDIDEPIAEHGGEVHSYVGDAVVITWPLSGKPERNDPRFAASSPSKTEWRSWQRPM